MTLETLVEKVAHHDDDQRSMLAPGLALVRRSAPVGFEALVYEPIVCLILQGEKVTTVADRTARVSAGHTILVSHDLPVLATVTQASPERPYLSLVMPIDVAELRTLRDEMGEDVAEPTPPRAFVVTPVDPDTLAVIGRYVALADDPDEARVLAPLVRRELHYRLLKAECGGMLRSLLRRDSHASNIARAIKRLRSDFRDRLEVERLARSVGMSASSFYKHFKAVTATTPLQYQKDLRLTEARRLLLGGLHSVSTAAFEVGYESASQFSREYSRKFGTAPRLDLPA